MQAREKFNIALYGSIHAVHAIRGVGVHAVFIGNTPT
jgi:hypothetical protein